MRQAQRASLLSRGGPRSSEITPSLQLILAHSCLSHQRLYIYAPLLTPPPPLPWRFLLSYTLHARMHLMPIHTGCALRWIGAPARPHVTRS